MEIITGILVSLVVEGIKTIEKRKNTKLSKFETLIFVFGLSFLGSLIYFLLTKYGLWETFAKVLLSAGGFHNLVIRRLDEK